MAFTFSAARSACAAPRRAVVVRPPRSRRRDRQPFRQGACSKVRGSRVGAALVAPLLDAALGEVARRDLVRRSVLTGIICGAAVATLGLAVMPRAAKSMPLGAIKAGAVKPLDLVEEARVTVHVHPRGRHRHWRCWWHRGRRVCGWR